MNKKIITIAGIVFALIFVIILAVMMATITNKAENANVKLVDTLDANDAQSIQAYEDGEVKGETVIGAIKNIKSIGGQYKVQVIVHTKLNSPTVTNGLATIGLGVYDKDNQYTAPAQSAKDYINPKAEFSTKVNRNENNVPVSIEFQQKN